MGGMITGGQTGRVEADYPAQGIVRPERRKEAAWRGRKLTNIRPAQ